MNFPDDLKYTSEHEWVRFTDEKTADGRPIAIVGITDFAQGELGELVYIEVDTIGDTIAKDAIFGTVEAVKTVSDLFLPVAGTITEINPLLDGQPELVNSDPYGDGWMVKMTVTDVADIEKLMNAEAYKASVG